MTLNFGFWGVLAGWVLMPRWWKPTCSSYVPTAAYFFSLAAAMIIVRVYLFDMQARLFVFGMLTQFVLFSLGGWALRSLRRKRVDK